MAGLHDGQSDRMASCSTGCLTAGLVGQFVLVLVLVYREQGTLRWSVVKDALWLHRPQRPDGRRMGWAWLVLVLPVVAIAAKEALLNLPMPAIRDMGLFLGSDAGQSFLSGNWPGWPSSSPWASSTLCWARSCCSAACCCPG